FILSSLLILLIATSVGKLNSSNISSSSFIKSKFHSLLIFKTFVLKVCAGSILKTSDYGDNLFQLEVPF
ncbi:MAG: hypothetical protein ACRD6Q_05515, partial [Nitrososphaeraceae archaeon]